MSALPIVEEKQASGVRLALTLTIAGALSGVAIVGTYEVTLPIITANKAEAQRRAVLEVVPGAVTVQPLGFDNGVLRAVEKSTLLFGAYDAESTLMGYALGGKGAGFQDTIVLIVGFDPDRKRLTGMRVLESRETPGLGDKIFKDQAFVSSFGGLAVEPDIVAVKGGASADNEIDAITGATISSKAVVKIVNATVAERIDSLPPRAGAPKPVDGFDSKGDGGSQ